MNPRALIQKLMEKVKGPAGEAAPSDAGKGKTKLIVALAVLALASGGGLATSLVFMKKKGGHSAKGHGSAHGKQVAHPGEDHGDSHDEDSEHSEDEGEEHASHDEDSHDSHDEGEHHEDSEHADSHDDDGGHEVAHHDSDEEDSDHHEAEESHGHDKGHGTHAKGHGHSASGILKTYQDAVESVQAKVHELRVMDEEVRRLRLENANLRLRNESLQFDCRASDAVAETRDIEIKLGKETGNKVGRTLASIQYRPPANMLPSQLYTLAATYFKNGDNEKAAVILTFLTGLEDSDAFKEPKSFLMTGVAWYRLDNFELADFYFGKVLEKESSGEGLQYQAQARLWRALAAQKTNKHTKSQFWLTELVDHHPQSLEAGWVNQAKEVKRAPTSTHQSKPHASSGHH